MVKICGSPCMSAIGHSAPPLGYSFPLPPSQVFQEEAPDAFPMLHQTQQRRHYGFIAEEGDEEEGEEDDEDAETPEFR